MFYRINILIYFIEKSYYNKVVITYKSLSGEQKLDQAGRSNFIVLTQVMPKMKLSQFV